MIQAWYLREINSKIFVQFLTQCSQNLANTSRISTNVCLERAMFRKLVKPCALYKQGYKFHAIS